MGWKSGYFVATRADRLSIFKNLKVDGGFIAKRVSVSADYTMSDKDFIVGVDTSGGTAVTVTLPPAENGKVVIIKDEGGASQQYNITVQGSGGATIDGNATASIATNYGVLMVYSDGTNWFTI